MLDNNQNYFTSIIIEDEKYIKRWSNQGIVYYSKYSLESEVNFDQFTENYNKTVKLMKELDQSIKKSQKSVNDSNLFINRANRFIEEVEYKIRLKSN